MSAEVRAIIFPKSVVTPKLRYRVELGGSNAETSVEFDEF